MCTNLCQTPGMAQVIPNEMMPMRGMGAAHVAPDTGNDATRSEMEDERWRSPKLLRRSPWADKSRYVYTGWGGGSSLTGTPSPPCRSPASENKAKKGVTPILHVQQVTHTHAPKGSEVSACHRRHHAEQHHAPRGRTGQRHVTYLESENRRDRSAPQPEAVQQHFTNTSRREHAMAST